MVLILSTYLLCVLYGRANRYRRYYLDYHVGAPAPEAAPSHDGGCVDVWMGGWIGG